MMAEEKSGKRPQAGSTPGFEENHDPGVLKTPGSIARWKPYPKYRDSGVEWLGAVPEGWEVKRLKEISVILTGGTPKDFDESLENDNGIPWIKPENLLGDNGINGEYEKLEPDYAQGIGIVESESTLVCGIGTVGKFGFINIPVCTNQQINAITFHQGVRNRYGCFIISCLVQEFQSYSNKVTISICNKQKMGIPWICVPPISDQEEISSFLDRETTKIDSLIAKKERLIELLQEKRTALITRAVTKGLSPTPGSDGPRGRTTIKFKDSGVEWLGEIPDHWNVIRMKFISPLQAGFSFKSESFGIEGIPIVRMSNLRRGTLDLDDAVRIPMEECKREFELKIGDILLGMSGSLGETGSLGNYAIVRESDIPSQLNQRVGRFQVTGGIDGSFLVYFLGTPPFTEPILADSTGTAQFNISPESIGNILIALPSRSEQGEIIEFLDREIKQIDALLAKVQSAISLLKEYRTALISAAVTGKIDVRGEAA